MEISHILAIAGWVFAPVCSGLLVALRDQRKRTREALAAAKAQEDEERKMMRKTFKAVLRKDLVDAYRDYVTDGKPLTVERKHEITEGYEAYAYWGGNGTGRDMYEGICEVPVAIIK